MLQARNARCKTADGNAEKVFAIKCSAKRREHGGREQAGSRNAERQQTAKRTKEYGQNNADVTRYDPETRKV
jgi:hypothetical protein